MTGGRGRRPSAAGAAPSERCQEPTDENAARAALSVRAISRSVCAREMNHAATAGKLCRKFQEIEQRITAKQDQHGLGSRAEMLQTVGKLNGVDVRIKSGQILSLIN